jgi:hypothetical protein
MKVFLITTDSIRNLLLDLTKYSSFFKKSCFRIKTDVKFDFF